MIKLTKNLLFNPAEIEITGIKCSFNNIVKISSLFDLKWIVVTVDSVTEGSSLIKLVKDHGWKYFLMSRSVGYTELSAVVPYHLFEYFLDKAIEENPENIFVSNLRDPANSVMCLQRSFDELVIAGIIDVFISISLDENAVLICVNKSRIIPKELFKKLKALCFD